MSERLSSVEIEDVLSSIRRLVSDDLRPAKGAEPAAAAATQAVAAPSGDKLILTPALRIAPDPAMTAEGGDEGADAPAAFQSVRRGGAGRVDAVMGEVARGLDPDAAEPEAAVQAAGTAPDWFAFVPADAPQPGAADEAPIAIDIPVEDAPVEAATVEEDVWDVPPADGTDHAAMAAPEVEADQAEVWEEAAMADTEDMARPEPLAEMPPAQDDARWADEAEAEIRRELEEDMAASAEASVFARFDADDHDDRPFDEEMLRDLVRDIIREELQGALGERITRNVRKLVRSEIARALAVRDFE